MRVLKTVAVLSLLATLAACGGGTPGTSTTQPTTPTGYNFVVPAVNSALTYTSTILDNSSNTINLSFTNTVTAINADGSFVVHQVDPSHNVVTVNGTNYSIEDATLTVNKADQVLSSLNNVTNVTCIYTPFGAGPSFPITINTSWSNGYTETCGSNAPITFTQTGAVVDVESITVPAGTFSTLKLFDIIVYTDAQGTIHNQAYTTWRDVKTGVKVKQQLLNSYGGTPPTNGYATSNTIELQSGTP